MTAQRDFLERAPSVVGSTNEELLKLMAEQNDYLQNISRNLREQQADVLASAVVKSTSQLTNTVTDSNSHEVVFEVGGKPVQIYSLLAYSTYSGVVALSPLSLSKLTDGIPFAAGDVYNTSIPTWSMFILTDLAGGNLVVNGPAPTSTEDTAGGFFLYGYTIPDWDRIRGARRS